MIQGGGKLIINNNGGAFTHRRLCYILSDIANHLQIIRFFFCYAHDRIIRKHSAHCSVKSDSFLRRTSRYIKTLCTRFSCSRYPEFKQLSACAVTSVFCRNVHHIEYHITVYLFFEQSDKADRFIAVKCKISYTTAVTEIFCFSSLFFKRSVLNIRQIYKFIYAVYPAVNSFYVLPSFVIVK